MSAAVAVEQGARRVVEPTAEEALRWGKLPHYISLGAGVQSSTMALMAAAGELLPRPDACIFADTGDEPQNVYKWLAWLETQLPFPVYRVQRGVLSADSLIIRRSGKSGKLYLKTLIPAFVKKEDGKVGLLGRKCTRNYKVDMILRKVKELGSIKRAQKVVGAVQWIGISTDEAHRMKPSHVKWSENRWPLIDAGMSRKDCLAWMKSRGYPEPPRSACVFCPFHSDSEWRRLRDNEPEEFAVAVKFEKDLQRAARKQEALTGIPYLTRRCVPLDKIEFGDEPGHQQVNLFGNECEGLCGV